jgi:branched-chain amino acid transport system ATP-binding protein
MPDALLQVRNLDAFYGEIQILYDVSLEVQPGEIVAILGANAAGKSTLMWALSGLVRWQGEAVYAGNSLQGLAAHDIVARGLIHVPEGRRLFPFLTVRENLAMGAYCPRTRAGRAESYARVLKLFPRLQERFDQLAGTLSGGEQQMCALGRGLMERPDLLILDEPSLGLAPLVIDDVYAAIQEINRQGVSVLLVEQNVELALQVASRGYVMENGRITLSGSSAELANDERLRESYLGL